MNFKFYDILGHIIPGVLIVTVCLYFKITEDILFITKWSTHIESLKLSSVIPVVFLVASYIAGYLISGLSSWSEKLLWYLWGGRPSTILLKKSRQYFGKTFIIRRMKLSNLDKIQDILLPSISDDPTNTIEIDDIDRDDVAEIFQKVKYKALYNCSENQQERLQNFFDSYLFSRNLLIAILLVFSSLLYFAFSWQLLILGLLFLLVLFKRCYDRAIYYSRELFETALSIIEKTHNQIPVT